MIRIKLTAPDSELEIQRKANNLIALARVASVQCNDLRVIEAILEQCEKSGQEVEFYRVDSTREVIITSSEMAMALDGDVEMRPINRESA